MAYEHKSHCDIHNWPLTGPCSCGAVEDQLYEALSAIGTLPEGHCFCFNKKRDATQPDEWHTGECREARAALSASTQQ